ncbi:MAG: hydrogenase iron-sulfur subunit [Thermoplasmata archaeon]|nr:hydrogenase iron-sulfur subunit [Thermoplasmata archaeon]
MVKPKPKVKSKAGNKIKKNKAFEPKILAFCCNWCSYAGADLAGVSRVQYPPNIRIIRIMCSGRIEPSHIIAAFETGGADGVVVSGCHPGDCHYISGNLRAEEQITRLQKLFDIIGFDSRRLRLQWVSASEGHLFGEYIAEFVELIKNLGPNPLLKPNSSPALMASVEQTGLNKTKSKAKAEVTG